MKNNMLPVKVAAKTDGMNASYGSTFIDGMFHMRMVESIPPENIKVPEGDTQRDRTAPMCALKIKNVD